MGTDLFGFQPLVVPPGAFDPIAMSIGEPGTPRRVIWQGREVAVASVTPLGATTARDRGGSAERYRERHRYRVSLADGVVLEVYFDRRSRNPRTRWWARECAD